MTDDLIKVAEGWIVDQRTENNPLFPVAQKLVDALKAERAANDDLVRKLRVARADQNALDLIHEIMSGQQWRPNAWADIAETVEGTGREILR